MKKQTELWIVFIVLSVVVICSFIYSVGLIVENYPTCKQEGKLEIYCMMPFDKLIKTDKELVNTVQNLKQEIK